MKKFLITLLTVVALALMLVVPALAEETPSTVVTYDQGDVWENVLAEVKAPSAQYIKLNADTENVTINKDLYLDLNGHTISTVTVTGGQLKVFDSTISDYDLENGYGTISNIVLDGGSVIRDFVLPADFEMPRYRYVTFQHEGDDNAMVYSSHRIYLTMKHKLLMPTRAAVDCQVVLQCDAITANNIAEYGVKMYLHLDGNVSATKYGYVRDGEGLPVAPTAGTNDKVIRVFDILRDDLQLDEQELRAEDTVMNARAYLKFKERNTAIDFTPRLTDEDYEVVGTQMSQSFKDITEEAQDIIDNPQNAPLASDVQSALNAMYGEYKALMQQWDVPIYCLCGASRTGDEHALGCSYETQGTLVWQRYQEGCMSTTGNYYLVADLTDQTQIIVTSGTALKVNLNLNGKNITAETGQRVFSVRKNATLSLTNTDAGDNKGIVSSVGHAEGAGVVHVTYAGDSNGTAPVLNMFSGVTLANTEVVAQDGTARTPNGGVIKLDTGTLNMYGGTITGGKTTDNGGNVYINANATVTVYDGANITEGTAPNGGNIYSNGILTIQGGSITGGTGTSNRDTADIFNVGGEVNLNGGVVGYACGASSSPGTVNVSGSPEVTQLKANATVNITGALTADADITIVPKSGVPAAKLAENVTLTATELKTTAQAFSGTTAGTVGNVTNSTTGEINLATGAYYCLCGATKNGSATHKPGCTYATEGLLFWQPYTSGSITVGGNYYLTTDNVVNIVFGSNNENAPATTVRLDLNGHNMIRTTAGRNLQVWQNFSVWLTNSGATGGLISSPGNNDTTTPSNNHSSALQIVKSSASVYMLDGVTLKHNVAEDDQRGYTTVSGGAVTINGTLTMYGGTIEGGKVTGDGAAVYVSGTFIIHGGTINGGTANNGGTIYNKGTLTIKGGTINGGTAATNGGTIWNSGTLTISGGTINNGSNQGSANNGASCVFNYGGTVNVSGGTIVKLAGASSKPGTFKVSGNPVINLMIPNTTISITGALNGAEIHMLADAGTVVAQAGTDSQGNPVTLTNEMAMCFTGTGNTVGVVTDAGIKLAEGVFHCICGASEVEGAQHLNPGCDGTLLFWQAWTSTTELPSDNGNWYLTGDVTASGTKIIAGTSAQQLKCVNLDLNGYNITSTARIYRVEGYCYLSLTNTRKNLNAGQNVIGTIRAANGDHAWAVIMTRNANSAATELGVNIYPNVSLVNTDTTAAAQNSALNVAHNAVINMYGGSISGANTNSTYCGGTVHMDGGTFNMYAGTIIGGNSVNYGGGAICVNGKNATQRAVLNMYGGAINGTVVQTGSASTVKDGGAILVGANGTANIYGGTVTGTTVTGNGGAIYNGGVLYIGPTTVGNVTYTGGTVTGGSIYNAAGKTVNIGGAAKISELILNGTDTVKIVAELTGDANVHFNAATGTVVAQAGTDSQGNTVTLTNEMAMCFTGTGDTIGTVTDAGIKLQVGVYHCICGASQTGAAHLNPGCDGKLLFWQPYSGETFATSLAAGNYYLTKSLTGSAQLAITGTADARKVINIDLNGWNITVTGGRVFQVGDYATLGLSNTKLNPNSNPDAGALSTVSGNAATWTTVQMRTTGCMNVYPGVSLVSGATAASNQGSVIVLAGTSTVNMYGGKVSGAKVNVNWNGGTVEIEGGTMNVYSGALIEGSEAIIGGAVYVKSGKLNLKGGTIDGNKSSGVTSGGAVYVNSGATMEMTSGTINGGAATNGGAIYNAGTLTISGGTINGSNVGTNGGAVWLSGTLNISGDAVINKGAINGDTTKGSAGIFAYGGTVNMNGGHIKALFAGSGKESPVNVQGAAKIDKYEAGGTATNWPIRIVGALTAEAQINVSKGSGVVVAVAGKDANGQTVTLTNEMAGCFFGTNNTVGFVNDEGKVELMLGYCMCGASKTGETCDPNSGCDGTIYAWEPYTAGCTTSSGNYYLTNDIVDAGQLVFGVRNDTSEKTIRLDLNGHSITRSSGRATQVWDCTTVWLCNTGTADETHGLISSGGVGISNGVIDSANTDNHSAALQMTKTTVTVNMLAGVTLKNNAAAGLTMNRAGAVNVVGTFNMFGGKIIGGNVANQGGAINIQSGSTFNMHAGTITSKGKTAGTSGGAIHNSGILNIYGGTITGGTAANGGAIYSSGTLTVANATISGGTATEQGNTVYSVGTLKLSGALQIADIISPNKISVTGELSGTVGVTMLADYGRFTDAGGAPYKNVFTISGGKEVRTDADGLYVRYQNTDNAMYVAHAQVSLEPTAEQFAAATTGYKDSSGYKALAISGYGRYQAATGMDSQNPLQADVFVVTDDQGDTIVMITADVGSVADGYANTLRTSISTAYGIPVDNIMISATHIHSAPQWSNSTKFYAVNSSGAPITDSTAEGYALHEIPQSYFGTVKERILTAVGSALDSRQKVVNVIQYTVADANAANLATNNKIFHEVRNYEVFDASGKIGMFTNNHQSYDAGLFASLTYKPETDVDSSLQIAGYVLQDGKQILIANFQVHPIVNGLGDVTKQTVHADMIGYFRKAVEAKYSNCEVMYFSGASGNVDPKANKGSNENKNYSSAQNYGEALAALIPADLTGSAITVTDVKAISTTLTGNIQDDGTFKGYDLAARLEIVAQIRAEVAAGDYDAGGFMPDYIGTNLNGYARAQKHATYAMQYGIYSTYHASHMYSRQVDRNAGKTSKTMTLGAYKIGDLAVISAPYEMYCENGKQVKDASGAGMTMVASLANGAHGYIPSEEGYNNGGYSTDSSWFEAGTGEAAVEKFNEMLVQLFPAK